MKKAINFLRSKLEIIFAGGQSAIGKKNGIIVKYGRDAIVVDWGQDPDANFDEGLNNQMLDLPDEICPNINLLNGLRVLGFCATHGHMDHIGAWHKLYERYPNIPLITDRFTDKVMRMLAGQKGHKRFFSSFLDGTIYDNSPIELGPFRITRFPVNHSIVGSCGFVIEAGGQRVVITGDFKTWIPYHDDDGQELRNKNTEVFGRISEMGPIDTLVMDSTSADLHGMVISENGVARNIGEIMRNEPGIIYISMILSNTYREQLIIEEARSQCRPVYVCGSTARNFLHLFGVSGWEELVIKEEEDCVNGVVYSHQIVPYHATLPRNAVIFCSGSQGEEGSFLDRVAKGDFCLPHRSGTLIVAQGVVPGSEKRFSDMIACLADNEGIGKIVLPWGSPHIPSQNGTIFSRNSSLTSSGHGPLNHKQTVYEYLKPRIVIPCHGPRINKNGGPGVRTILAKAVHDWGGEAILVDDGDKFVL